MKRFFYYFIKFTIKWASHCYFRKIKVYGLENIPKDGGILFSPNHQGAFLDPLLVGCNLPKTVTSLTRSDVFGGPLQWFMDALKMLPVYRIRNGYSNLKKNEAIFESCKSLLSNREYIMMFSEASHHSEFFLQTLSKGSSRLAYEAQQQSKNPIYIVPIGINYGHHTSPLCDLHLVFGEAIAISRFTEVGDEKPTIINTIRDELGLAMKKCMWLPDRDEHYDARKKLIHNQNTHRRSFQELKEGIEVQSLEPKKIRNTKKWHTLIIKLFSIPNLPPLLILKRILRLFKDIVFYSSIKLCAGLFLFLFWWGSIFLFSAVFWGWTIAVMNTVGCISLLYIRQYLSIKNL